MVRESTLLMEQLEAVPNLEAWYWVQGTLTLMAKATRRANTILFNMILLKEIINQLHFNLSYNTHMQMIPKTVILLFFIVTLSYGFQFEAEPELAMARNVYPIRAGYIDRIDEYIPPERLAASFAVPGYSDEKIYNYVMLGFWRCSDVPTGAALAWSKPVDYFGDDSVFGKTKEDIQKNLHDKYTNGHSHVLVSAFGPKENPTTLGLSAVECAQQLATFVISNQLDGTDINWQDEQSLGFDGYDWLVSFHTHLRKLLPNYTITHSPSASFFRSEDYNNKSYTQVNAKINSTLNFYNVHYYNLGTSRFSTYNELFLKGMGDQNKTAVMELVERGVELKKIVVTKPVTPSDSTGSGWVDQITLGEFLTQAYTKLQWFAGITLWQYASDIRGKAMINAATKLKELCQSNQNCK